MAEEKAQVTNYRSKAIEAERNMSGQELDKQPHLVDYYYVLRKRKWLVVSTLFLTVLFTALITFSMKPIYRATSSVLIDKEAQQSPLTGERVDFESYASQQLTFQTHFKVITSRPVLERVLEKLALDDESLEGGLIGRFISTVRSNVKRFFSLVFSPSKGDDSLPSEEERVLAERIEKLRGKIEVEEVRNTRLMNINVEDNDPQTARLIANSLADTYIQYESGTRLESSRKMLDWLSQQLYGMKKKVEDAEKAFLEFKEKENLFSIEGKQKINVQKIEEMNGGYIDARSKRLEVEAKIEELKKFAVEGKEGRVKNIPTFVESDTLQGLYADLLAAEVQYRELSGVLKHKHPEVVQVTAKIKELRSKIFEEIQKAVENAQSERAVLIARERALEEAVDRYEKDAIKMNRKGVQYAILEREVETNRQLYNVLLAKIKEANITDEVTKTNLRLVQPASTPVKPVKPRKMLNLLLSLVLGSMTGVGLAFFLEYLDRTLRSREEVERLLEVPVLAEVPLEDSREYPKTGKDEKRTVPSVLEAPMNSYFTEAFRILVANMSFSTVDRPKGVYLVTSSSPMEGKSTVTYNLGHTLARFGAKTLIVDADLRRPMMRRIAGLKAKKGMSEILVVTFSTKITSGELGEMTIGDIHKLIEIQERTGVLHYKNEKPLFKVSFHNGRIVSVDGATGSLEERLATLLVQSGKITKQQAQIALSKRKSTSIRFEEVLLHLGFLAPDDLAGSLTLNLEENIRKLYSCEHANFDFEEGSDFLSPVSNFMAERTGNGARDLNGASSKSTPFLADKIRQYIVQVGEENLWMLPSGRIPPNPTEFLANKRMKALLEILRGEFDIVLLDSPPAATMSDAKIMARYCDGIIMVVRAGSTHVEEIRRAKEQLDSVQAPIVGAVLNMLDVRKDPYYYKYYVSKYQNYYAKDTKKPRERKIGGSFFSRLTK